MPFPEDALADHETLIFDLKQHWIALVPSVFWTLIAIVGGVVLTGIVDGKTLRLMILVAALAVILFLA
ncbi:MAG TPA: hypothetical protein VFK89_01330, partial [Actinomycetota bacterium]|nr:hypothetical protein [Actinomycetota bacterium]